MINRNYFSKKAGISYFEILTLVIASFAFCFIIYESEKPLNNIQSDLLSLSDSNLATKIPSSLINLLWAKISTPIIPLVNALASNCCEKTKEGAFCQDVEDSSKCADNANLAAGFCEFSESCSPGCCIDEIEGTYDKNVPKLLCNNMNKTWKSDRFCNLPEAKLGCCVLGRNTQFITSQRCIRLSDQLGVSKDWRTGLDEIKCIKLIESFDEGACISIVGQEKQCQMTTRVECISLTKNEKNFNKNLLCTSPSLNTTCKKTSQTKILPGKDEVYFIDSCENRANIYDSSKVNDNNYWNSIVPKNLSCGFDSNNANTNSEICGNCNRLIGSIGSFIGKSSIKPNYGKYYCKTTSCQFTNSAGINKTYKNGESWCDFDGKIGNGDDIPGSRHFKYICNQGEVQAEPCADARNEVCIEQTMDVIPSGILSSDKDAKNYVQQYQVAYCRVNNWRECVKDGSATTLDCMPAKFKYDTFEMDLIVPKNPEGFEFSKDSGATDICDQASKTCTVKNDLTACKCIENCQCQTEQFGQDMNDVCRKLGDCGGEVNIAGVSTKNYEIIDAPDEVEIPDISKPVAGQKVEPGNISLYLDSIASELQQIIGAKIFGNYTAGSYISAILASKNAPAGIGSTGASGSGSGGMGVSGGLMIAAMGVAGMALIAGATYMIASSMAAAAASAVGSTVTAASILAGGSIVNSAIAGAAATSSVATAATGGTAAGAAAGASATAAAGAGGVGAASGAAAGTAAAVAAVAAVVCIVLILLLLILIILMLIFGMGGGKKCTLPPTEIKTFTCKPWQPPVGGKDCEKCNGNPMKPCSEYRCKSLGTACRLVNKGTSNELCINLGKNDTSIPNISVGIAFPFALIVNITSSGFRITGINKTCLDAYDTLNFNFSTTKPAQCKYDLFPNSFDNMTLYVGDNYYGYEHEATISLPKQDHLFDSMLNQYGTNRSSLDSSLKNLSDSNLTLVTDINSASDIPSTLTRGINMTNFSLDNSSQINLSSFIGNLTLLNTSTIIANANSINLFIKCRDYTGLETSTYTISTCVDPGKDYTAPRITKTIPENNSFIRWNATRQEFAIFTNEPSECKWSFNDQSYSSMETNMSCLNEIEQQTALGYRCDSNMPIEASQKTIYIRCKDQPWLESSDPDSRNVNTASYQYTLKRIASPLTISAIKPDKDIETGTFATTVYLKVKTSGGAPNPICSYSFLGYDNMINFFSTYSNIHEQELSLNAGYKELYISCKDSTGDVASNKTTFKINLDSTAPEITRIMQLGSTIRIFTNEESDCRYSTDSCNFNFNDGEKMISGSSYQHTIHNQDYIYYIKCKDKLGNMPDSYDCSTVIHSAD